MLYRSLRMRLRKLGIPVPWRIAEIQDEWFGGNVLNWDTLDIEESFRAAQLAAGSRWVLGSEIGLTPFGGLEGIGRRGGFSEFLRAEYSPASLQLVKRRLQPTSFERATEILNLSSTPRRKLAPRLSIRTSVSAKRAPHGPSSK